MLFEIDKKSLTPFTSSWVPRELELEEYLITSDSDAPILDSSVFGEPLMLISNQVRTKVKKRADILAIDRAGNGVVIELKRDKGALGVETQALQYLADFSNYKGRNFIDRFSKNSDQLEESILSFMGGNAEVEDINKNSRLILMARDFDPTIYSLGEWFSNHGVSFRCIQYTPVEIEERRFLSFSIAFDRSPELLFPIIFGSSTREPGIYWHNIARADQAWWEFLVKKGQIPTCFKNQPGDQGEKILKSYIAGDIIVAYAKKYGAVGWGVIDRPSSYKLLQVGDKEDLLGGHCLHRLSISWKSTAKQLNQGVPSNILHHEFGIYHPVSTSVGIDSEKGKKLIEQLSQLFGI